MKNSILNLLKKHKKEIEKKFDVKKLILVGSFARNEAKTDSDIDILVDMPKDFDKFFELKYFLENLLKREVDLGYYNNIRHYIKKQMLKDEINV